MKNYSQIDTFPIKKKTWLGRMYVAWIMLNLYPYRTLCILTAMFIASIAEGLGLLTVLPLIEIISQTGTPDPDNKILSGYAEAFNSVGLDLNLPTILIAMVTFICLKALITFIAQTYVGKVTIDITTELRSTLITRILSARWSFFISQPIGKLVNAVSVEASGATNVYSNSIRMLSDLLKVIVLLYIAFKVSPAIVLVALVVGICLFLFLDYFILMSRKAGKLLVELTQSMTAIMTDALQGIKPLKTMNSERLLIPILHDEINNIKHSMFRQLIAGQVIAATYEPVAVIVVAIGMYFAISHFSIPMSEILVLVVLFQRTIGGITQMQGSYQKVLSWEQYYWSVANFVNTASNAKEVLKGSKIPDLVKEIKIQGLSFSYGSKKVLEDISLDIIAFSFTALVGRSGSGKTTLIDLLCGLYPLDSGNITIDGISLNDIDIMKWRSSIGYVPQELFLFHDSIMTNVSLGDPEITRQSVEEALRSAGAWDFITELPEELDTIIGERGARLSGGQRQRIAIARALVRKPKLLILDEATTALDKKTENDILTTLHKLVNDITIIAISHQSALLDLADKVYEIRDHAVHEIK